MKEETMREKRLMLVDLSGIFWAAWHATKDQETNAAYEATIAKVRSLAGERDFPIAICCDLGPYKRKEIFPDYKAQRDAPDPAAVDQLARVIERLDADGFHVYRAKGYEADDLIATFCEWADDYDVTIASNDKDLMQLVDDRTLVVSTMTGDVYGPDAVEKKFGVPPHKMADYLALVGDKSDNVPGVAGVGQKHAARLLAEFGDVEELLLHADEVTPPSIMNKLVEHGTAVRLSRQLVTLLRDAPIECATVLEEKATKPLSDDEDVQDADFDDDDSTPSPPPPPNGNGNGHSRSIVLDRGGDWSRALEPTNPKQAWGMAKALFASRVFPTPNVEATFAIVMKGRSLGLDAVTSLTNFHFIEGKPTMFASLIIGLVQAHDDCEYFYVKETTTERCTWVIKRRQNPEPQELTWTLEDAKRAKLAGVPTRSGKPSQWDKMPRTMLRWRCGVELARMVFSDVLSGVYSRDEMGAEEQAA